MKGQDNECIWKYVDLKLCSVCVVILVCVVMHSERKLVTRNGWVKWNRN